MTDNRQLILSNAADEETRRLLDYINRQDFDALDDNYEKIFAPFSYFGGKRLNVVPVWRRYGVNIPNYIEPFSGSAAMFYGRPANISGKFRRELLNDECRLLINAYRAIKYANPADLAEVCQKIYAEDDLIAWNKELIRNRSILRDKIQDDMRYYNLELAGRWIWLTRGWIGAGACDATINIKSKIPRSRIAGWYGNSPVSHFSALKRRLADAQLSAGGYNRALESFTQTRSFGMTAAFFDPP